MVWSFSSLTLLTFSLTEIVPIAHSYDLTWNQSLHLFFAQNFLHSKVAVTLLLFLYSCFFYCWFDIDYPSLILSQYTGVYYVVVVHRPRLTGPSGFFSTSSWRQPKTLSGTEFIKFLIYTSFRTCTPVPPQWLIRAGSRYYDLELFPECDAKDEITEVKYGLNKSPLLAF